MATVLDTKVLPKALAAIAKYGRDVAVQGKPTGYSTTTGATTPGASLGTVKAVVGTYERDLQPGEVVQQEDVQLIIAGSGLAFTPEVGQLYTVEGRKLVALQVIPYSSGEQIAAWEVRVGA